MAEAGDDAVEITISKNGPTVVRGRVTLKAANGETWDDLPEGKPVALCRCGQSGHKPFCDGSHNKVDFASVPNPTDDPYPY